jgi:two-component system, OmpR family, response regulator BaeR
MLQPKPMLFSILVVEDDNDIAAIMLDYLHHYGFKAKHLDNGDQAIREIQSEPPDLVLLDVMLPGADGFTVLQTVRQTSRVPIIMVTARVEEVDRLLGLDCGADDYICKPFSPRELISRVQAVLRRLPYPRTLEAPEALILDAHSLRASLYGQALQLTAKEFDLLQTLAAHPGRVYSRSQLLELVYSNVVNATERSVDSHVKNLRRKFSAIDTTHEWIRSVYGVGFSFEVSPAAPPRLVGDLGKP